MKFIRKGSMSAGWSPPFLYPEHYMQLDTSKLTYVTVLLPKKYKYEGKDLLEMNWFYLVLYNRQQLLRYDFEQSYFIEGIETLATDEELRDVIIDSYKALQNSFGERLSEFVVFREVVPINDEVIEKALERLRVLFPAA